MPTFFHGDHAATFISGSWLRGLHDFDLERAYKLILKNATVPGKGGRPVSYTHLLQMWMETIPLFVVPKMFSSFPMWDMPLRDRKSVV